VCAKLGLKATLGNEVESVWEIRDFNFELRGWVSRDYANKRIRTWRLVPGPLYGFWSLAPSKRIIIVEDPVSAARIAWEGGASGVALLGTHMPAEAMEELEVYVRRTRAVIGTEPEVVVCLDRDAVDVTTRLTKRLTGYLSCATMWFPGSRDPKDMDRDELLTLTGGC
jgi:hypothetical protein